MPWIVQKKFSGELNLKNPVLIGGLPGIGNVGKLAVDFMIDELKPTLIYNIHSYLFPNSVFINEKNMVELPQVNIYAFKSKTGKDLLLLSGDVQPIDEESSYKFCNKILDLAAELGCKEVLTLGGIGLSSSSKNPKVFGAATDQETKDKYIAMDGQVIFNKNKASTIVGAAGLLLGLATLRDMKGVSLLVETFGHRFYLGLKEAKELLKNLNNIFSLGMDLDALDREIKKAENAEKKDKSEEEQAFFKSLKRFGAGVKEDTNYIG